MTYHRLTGIALKQRKLLIYGLRTNRRMTFTDIGRAFGISRQMASQDYYTVLRNEKLRDEAHQWRIPDVRYIPRSLRN